MNEGLNCSGWANPGATPRGQPSSKRQPESHVQRSKRNIVRPLSWMQINNEERCGGEEARLGAQQAAIGAPVVGARALIPLLGVAPHVPPVRSQRARVRGGTADIEQRIPLATRTAVFLLREDDQGRDAGGGEPFAVMHDGSLERGSLVIGGQ